jgi:transposase
VDLQGAATSARHGESTARPQVNHVPPKLLSQHEAIRLKLKTAPDLTLAELRAWLRDEHQVSISQRGMWKTLRQLDLTRKKRPSMHRSRTVPTSPRRDRIGATASRN